jgi:hypothetical protein
VSLNKKLVHMTGFQNFLICSLNIEIYQQISWANSIKPFTFDTKLQCCKPLLLTATSVQA